MGLICATGNVETADLYVWKAKPSEGTDGKNQVIRTEKSATFRTPGGVADSKLMGFAHLGNSECYCRRRVEKYARLGKYRRDHLR